AQFQRAVDAPGSWKSCQLPEYLDTRAVIRFRWIALIAFLAGCHHASVPLPVASSSIGTTADLVERGEYVVRNVSACGSCHTQDRKPDGPLIGGTEFKDWRLGTIRSANLTPDSATGLGTWTEAEIVRAIRNGQR